jgi:hypothetical protein
MPGSTLGTLLTVTNFGESHGPAIGCVVDGCPPGMSLTEADIQLDLDRRKPGTSRHVTQRREEDKVEILSGIFAMKINAAKITQISRPVFAPVMPITRIYKNTACVIIAAVGVLLHDSLHQQLPLVQ